MGKFAVAGIDLSRFVGVPYAGERHPGNTTIREFLDSCDEGSNCELFALAVLRLAGFSVEEKRSIELWHDMDFTLEVKEDGLYELFDLFFFLPKGADPHKVEEEVLRGLYSQGSTLHNVDPNELKKFHLGVYIGSIGGETDCIVHLPKPGPSAIWPLSYFGESEKKYWLFKVKRAIKKLHISSQ